MCFIYMYFEVYVQERTRSRNKFPNQVASVAKPKSTTSTMTTHREATQLLYDNELAGGGWVAVKHMTTDADNPIETSTHVDGNYYLSQRKLQVHIPVQCMRSASSWTAV